MNSFKNILVSGGSGFIGSSFVRHMVKKYPDCKIINVDKLTYAGNPDNLNEIAGQPNYKFYQADITDSQSLEKIIIAENIAAIVNYAAETHVDRSIHLGAREFVNSNILGVQTLLDLCRSMGIKRYIQISTDEVYGSLALNNQEKFTENHPFRPNSPYAASKAAGDLLCRAYFHTYKTPVIVTHCSNNYGPYQFPEKLIPFFILKSLQKEPLPLYGNGENVRDWIYVEDHTKAIDLILHSGTDGETYNIGSDTEKSNLEIAKLILNYFNLPMENIHFVTDRPGHDLRYAIDCSKLQKELGWKPEHRFEQAFTDTIDWYLKNNDWIAKIQQKNGEINRHLQDQNLQKPAPNPL